MTDYYQILGIDKTATEQEIKSAYRKLAMQHHPDRGGDAEQFQKINDAYSTLSDPAKRSQYDNPQTNFQHGSFNFDGMPPGFEDMFGGMGPFGQMFGFRRRAPQNPSLQLSTVISLEDAFTGRELLANITLPSGREQTIDVKIPAGIHENTTLRLSGIGDDSIPNAPRGDILLTVHIHEHPKFKRSGDDLIQDIEITCIDAMLGKILQVTSIDGKVLQTELPSGIQNDTVIGLSGNGMPNINDPSRRGRLLLRIKIKIPNLNEDQKNILRTLNLQ